MTFLHQSTEICRKYFCISAPPGLLSSNSRDIPGGSARLESQLQDLNGTAENATSQTHAKADAKAHAKADAKADAKAATSQFNKMYGIM